MTHLPHQCAEDLLPSAMQHLQCMQNFACMLEYLCSWRWAYTEGVIQTAKDFLFKSIALPLVIDDKGVIEPLGRYEPGAAVFADDTSALAYFLSLAKRDLQFRGMRDDRLRCSAIKQEANFLLYRKIRGCLDADEYSMYQQAWGRVNRPKYQDLGWSEQQKHALATIEEGVSHDDEEARRNSRRWLHIRGAPGSGKSAVLLEAAIRHCKHMQVLIMCPTGCQVYLYKAQLPEVRGVENVRFDMVRGVLN